MMRLLGGELKKLKQSRSSVFIMINSKLHRCEKGEVDE